MTLCKVHCGSRSEKICASHTHRVRPRNRETGTRSWSIHTYFGISQLGDIVEFDQINMFSFSNDLAVVVSFPWYNLTGGNDMGFRDPCSEARSFRSFLCILKIWKVFLVPHNLFNNIGSWYRRADNTNILPISTFSYAHPGNINLRIC